MKEDTNCVSFRPWVTIKFCQSPFKLLHVSAVHCLLLLAGYSMIQMHYSLLTHLMETEPRDLCTLLNYSVSLFLHHVFSVNFFIRYGVCVR